MLDFNHRPKLSEEISALIDKALTIENEKQTQRYYLGASRLGVSCNRALQFEYTKTPKDEGQNFTGKILRIFQAGHVFEELAIKWLRDAGFELVTNKSNGDQFGFSVVGGKIKGDIDGVITNAPSNLKIKFPMLWECKPLNNKSWNDTVKKGHLYTGNQFAEKFENQASLGGSKTINDRISVLATKGYIKFVRDVSIFGYKEYRSKYGLMCVQDMEFTDNLGNPHLVLPTHFKCPNTGAVLPVENGNVWVLHGEENLYSRASLFQFTYDEFLTNPKEYSRLLPNQIIYATARWKGIANWWGQAYSHLLNHPHRPDCKEVNFTSLFLPVCNGFNPVFTLLHPP